VAFVLRAMRHAIAAGMTTRELDAVAAAALRRRGARSAPRLHYRFPGHACISINDEVVHGVPGSRVIAAGDVVKLDVTADHGGYIADAATTVIVGGAPHAAERLRMTAVSALSAALAVATAGARVGAIGRAVESAARAHGAFVIRELCGHGVGRHIHEPPDVPNYDNPFSTATLTDGLVIAIEPILAVGHAAVRRGADGWTVCTGDGSLAVHEEHTAIITSGAPIVLTS
jgi:methionyl aminopeptidase